MSMGGFLQIYKMWRRKSSDDISIAFWIVMIHGLIWWFYYGITINSISLIVTNSICIILDSTVLIMIIKYRGNKSEKGHHKR